MGRRVHEFDVSGERHAYRENGHVNILLALIRIGNARGTPLTERDILALWAFRRQTDGIGVNHFHDGVAA